MDSWSGVWLNSWRGVWLATCLTTLRVWLASLRLTSLGLAACLTALRVWLTALGLASYLAAL